MARAAALAIAVYALVVGEPVTFPPEPALARVDLRESGPLAETWTPRHARLQASVVRLRGLGMRTHANWVLFRLPFDAGQRDRIRHVSMVAHADAPTNVGAFRLGSACVSIRPSGEAADWALYTTSGIAGTQRFAWHPAPPTDDPTVVGINVPTRVANHVACGRDDRLRDPTTWSLDVAWEVR